MNICEKKLDSSWFRPTFPRQFFPPLRFFARSRTFSLKSVRPAFTLAKTGDILSLKDFCTYMTLKSLNSSMISMLSIKKCEILGEGLWFLRTWLLPDALPLFASSRSLVFLVAVSLASVVFEGRTHASEWHWAYLQRLDLVVGLPCPDVQRGMCSHFWWEEHKNFPQKNQKFPPRFFLFNWHKRPAKQLSISLISTVPKGFCTFGHYISLYGIRFTPPDHPDPCLASPVSPRSSSSASESP